MKMGKGDVYKKKKADGSYNIVYRVSRIFSSRRQPENNKKYINWNWNSSPAVVRTTWFSGIFSGLR